MEKEEKFRQIMIRIGKILCADQDYLVYNIEDTKEEKPHDEGMATWEEFWGYYTAKDLCGQKCASCGILLNDDNIVGAHIRFVGEEDGTKDAWIAMFCKGCNNSRRPQKVTEGSWVVKTTMEKVHKNVKPVNCDLDRHAALLAIANGA